MKIKRIQNILIKEWYLLLLDINNLLMVTLLPLLIVGQGILYVWLAINFGGEEIQNSQLFLAALEKISNTIPALTQIPILEQFKVLLLSQFNFFLLLIPTMISLTFATFSIIDEKQSGSMEALLATPVRTWELLLGKALAGAIPALVMTWVSAGIFLLIINIMGWGSLTGYMISFSWFLSLFLLTPAIALLSFILGVIGSSRAKDAKNAQMGAIVIVLPVFALIILQVTGIVWLTPLLTVLMALVLGIIDYFMLRLAVRLFRRESILIDWK